jgi:putative ABC transport system ATP-binding protein
VEESTQAPAFVLAGVSLERPDAGLVLDGIDLEIPARRVTALVGPSGSGKTSLLRLLNRLEEPTAGEIRYGGRPLAGYPVRELRCRVGFIFQSPTLFPGTVRENLAVAAELAGRPPGEWESRMREALAAAELDVDLLERAGDRLSGGERQRVTIARALVASPEVLLMDEPTSALDPATADRLVETVCRMSRERGLTVVLVTHRHDEARRSSDATALLERGRVVAFGCTREVFAGADAAQPSSRRRGR